MRHFTSSRRKTCNKKLRGAIEVEQRAGTIKQDIDNISDEEVERLHVALHPPKSLASIMVHELSSSSNEQSPEEILINNPQVMKLDSPQFSGEFVVWHKVTKQEQLGPCVRIMTKTQGEYFKKKKRRLEWRMTGVPKKRIDNVVIKGGICGAHAVDTSSWTVRLITGILLTLVEGF